VAGIMSLVKGLIGWFQPDPVVEKLRDMDKDVMGRLSAVTDRVLAAIPQAISYHSLKTVLDTSQVPLTNIVRYWNNLYPNTGTNSTQNSTAIQNFGKQIDGDISHYCDQWSILARCLSGHNMDCVFSGKTPLEILLNGQDEPYMHPQLLIDSIQYYFLLLQKSSVAICAYSMLFLDDTECKLMPTLKDDMSAVVSAMSTTVTSMKQQFWGSMGANMLPPVIQYWVDQHANQGQQGANAIRDMVKSELETYYLNNSLDSFFGVDSYAVTIYSSVLGPDHHYLSSTGYKFRYNGYNIMYSFQPSQPGDIYSDTECRDGDAQAMWGCLKTKGAPYSSVWVLRSPGAFWAGTYRGAYVREYYDTGGGDVRIVTPGSYASALQ